MIRRQTEDIQHFTCNKRQAFNADRILQKKDHISVVFIFNVPDSNCFIILHGQQLWNTGIGFPSADTMKNSN